MPNHVPLIVAVFLLAGFVKGVTGLGLPMISLGLLSLVMTPAQAAALVVAPSMVTNVWQLFEGPALRPLVRRLWPMLLAVWVGTAAPFLVTPGGWLVGAGHGAGAALGGALVAYAALGLSPWRLPLVGARAERWLGPVMGGATGLLAAATGVFAVPAVPYLGSLGLDREELVQALGLAFTVSTVGLALTLGAAAGGEGLLAGSLVALGPALVGMFGGGWVRRAVRPAVFRRVFFVGLLGLGGHLVVRGLV